MNKKYVIKGCDFQVKEGDKITLSNLTTKDLDKLVKAGILQEKESLTLEDVFDSLARKMNITREEVVTMVNNITKVNPMVAFSMLLKEIAIILDKRYSNHILESKYLYYIDTVTGDIEYLKDKCVNSDTCSLFRCVLDAKFACILLKFYHNMIWG